MPNKNGLGPSVNKKARKNDYDRNAKPRSKKSENEREMRIKLLVAATAIKEIKWSLRSDSFASMVGVSTATFHPWLHPKSPLYFFKCAQFFDLFYLSLFDYFTRRAPRL
jgi:hypothetical protein